jgi:hypothetical protein
MALSRTETLGRAQRPDRTIVSGNDTGIVTGRSLPSVLLT